jgi:hypothetical protein
MNSWMFQNIFYFLSQKFVLSNKQVFFEICNIFTNDISSVQAIKQGM